MSKVFIAGIETKDEDFDYSMSELQALAQANQMEVINQFSQKLDHPLASSYFGSGKAKEIGELAELNEVEILIVNDELTPTQIRNLETLTKMTVLDRTALILDIFATRAQTKQAKLQVEIAKLQYQLPRLHTKGAEKLDQQGGGSVANRGAGEKKTELNRRVIEKKITRAKQALKTIEKEHELRNQARQKANLKTVALVGYTNAGKSTTLNELLKYTHSAEHKQVFEKNMLFATLDTAVRKIKFADNKEILLSDTVGFVSKLPHQLVEAFKTTLKEAAQADLLIQVIDASDEHAREMMATTESTLKEIGIENIKMIYAFNKADKTTEQYPNVIGNEINFSAKDKASLEALINLIKQELFADYQVASFLIPYTKGYLIEQLNQDANVLKTTYEAEGTLITAEVSPIMMNKLQPYKKAITAVE